jgi:hypothetical protein
LPAGKGAGAAFLPLGAIFVVVEAVIEIRNHSQTDLSLRGEGMAAVPHSSHHPESTYSKEGDAIAVLQSRLGLEGARLLTCVLAAGRRSWSWSRIAKFRRRDGKLGGVCGAARLPLIPMRVAKREVLLSSDGQSTTRCQTCPQKLTMGTDLHEFHQGQARRLIPLFMAWKALLILLAVLCPGPGYDTSGLILLSHGESHRDQFQSSSFLDRLALSHVRWDALYFVKAAQRGYVYEQEWAFSRAYSLILGIAKDCRFCSRSSACDGC